MPLPGLLGVVEIPHIVELPISFRTDWHAEHLSDADRIMRQCEECLIECRNEAFIRRVNFLYANEAMLAILEECRITVFARYRDGSIASACRFGHRTRERECPR